MDSELGPYQDGAADADKPILSLHAVPMVHLLAIAQVLSLRCGAFSFSQRAFS